MVGVLAFVLGLVSSCYALGTFTYRDCNTSPNKVLHFDHAQLSTDPIKNPGNETVSIDVHVLQPINGHDYQLDITLEKFVFMGFVKMECNPSWISVLGLHGSCSYDLCEILSGQHYNGTHHCPLQIKESSPDFNCACPFQPGDYHLNPTTFILEKDPKFDWLNIGDFRVNATITDTRSGEEVMCYHATVSIGTDCTGAACLVG